MTPLMMATVVNRRDLVVELLEAGAQVDMANSECWVHASYLHY